MIDMDDLDHLVRQVRPPVDAAALARARADYERRRRQEPRRRRSWRATVGGLTAAGLVGAGLAGGAVAAAASGNAPAPVARALTATGILPQSVLDPGDRQALDLFDEHVQGQAALARTAPAADGGVQVVVFGVPTQATHVRVELPGQPSVELAASTTSQPLVFLGQVPALAAGAQIVATGEQGQQVLRIGLADAQQLDRDLQAAADEQGAGK